VTGFFCRFLDLSRKPEYYSPLEKPTDLNDHPFLGVIFMNAKRVIVPVFAVLLVCLALVAAAPVAQAQGEQYLELIRQDLKTAKTAYMTEGMQLTTEQGDVFWPLYREYMAELSKVGDRRIANIKNYAEHFEAMTEEKASEILKQSFKNRKDEINLLEKYSKKVSKA
jgi:hypothetical protein